MLNKVTRWFPGDQVEPVVKQLMAEIAEAGFGKKTSRDLRYNQRGAKSLNMRTYILLGAVGLFILAVLFLPEFLPGEWLAKNDNMQIVVKLIMIAVPVGFGIAAKKRMARANKRIEAHDSCVEQLVDQIPSLCCTNAAAIGSTSVNTIPLMETGCRTNNLRCGLFGEYKGQPIALLESEYIARGLDATEMIKMAHANVVGETDKEQFSRVRSAEAILFFAPLAHLPDLLICGVEEPLCGFQKDWIRKTGNRPSECELDLGNKYRAFTSCISTANQTLTSEFFEILKLRPKAMVQVIGGHVVVIPRTWSAATPMDMAVTAFDIQLDLDFSSALYEQLAISAHGDALNSAIQETSLVT